MSVSLNMAISALMYSPEWKLPDGDPALCRRITEVSEKYAVTERAVLDEIVVAGLRPGFSRVRAGETHAEIQYAKRVEGLRAQNTPPKRLTDARTEGRNEGLVEGWNACLDYLVAQGLLTFPSGYEKPRVLRGTP